MARKPRTVNTLRAYITALRLFYQFVLAKYRSLNRKGTKILNEDLEKIKSCNVLLDGWLKTLAPAVHMRKAAVRKIDEGERLTKEDLKKLVNSEETKRVTKEMLQLERKPIRAVSRDQFAKYRDNLIVRMLCKAAQRPGALANLTVEEFDSGVWDRTAEPALYTTQTFFHKTSSSEGEATLFWNETNYRLAKIYQHKIRPLIAIGESTQLPPIPGAHNSRSAFFITFSGKRLTGGQITRHVNDFLESSCPDIKGRIKGSRIRKAIVSTHREEENPSVTSKNLAAQMTHHVSTADKYYHLDEKLK